MSTALFFITHEGIAENLLTIGESIIKKKNHNISFAEIPMDADINLMTEDIQKKIEALDTDEDIFFITDIYGSTPSNIAHKLANNYNTELITGVNLPMVIRLLNYRNEDKLTLIQKALDGASKGIQRIS